MAVGLIYRMPGVTQADYDRVNENMGIDENPSASWPDGLLSHAAGVAGGTFYLSEVWESREAQERFMRERLGGALQKAGFSQPPEMTWFDVFSFHTPERAQTA